MTTNFKMLINGELVESPDRLTILNPRTEDVVGYAPQITEQQVQDSLVAAKSGFAVWSTKTLTERQEVILRFVELLEAQREEVLELLMAETGKPRDNAEYDFGMLITCLRFFLEEMQRLDQPRIPDPNGKFLHYVSRQPLGVVVGYLAWNFPLLNLGYKLGPALAAGCSVILKPSQITPLASLRCAEIAKEAGFPPGVINVISGDRYPVTDPLLTSPDVSLFTMIGSTQSGVGAMQTAATSVKHFSVELGGNSPALVYADADLDKAVNDIVDLKFGNTGQVCVSPNRCYVHESIYEAFLDKAQTRAASISLKEHDPEARQLMGPMMTLAARDALIEKIQREVDAGARLICGGKAPSGFSKGFYMEPTIIADIDDKADLTCNEIFGPVLAVIPYSDEETLADRANDNEYGLAAYVYTENLNTALRAAEKIQSGSICVNEAFYDVSLPHGGLKQSGVGKDCSRYSLEEFLTLKRVSIRIN